MIRCQTKITYFHMVIRIQKDVDRLQIPVNHSLMEENKETNTCFPTTAYSSNVFPNLKGQPNDENQIKQFSRPHWSRLSPVLPVTLPPSPSLLAGSPDQLPVALKAHLNLVHNYLFSCCNHKPLLCSRRHKPLSHLLLFLSSHHLSSLGNSCVSVLIWIVPTFTSANSFMNTSLVILIQLCNHGTN